MQLLEVDRRAEYRTAGVVRTPLLTTEAAARFGARLLHILREFGQSRDKIVGGTPGEFGVRLEDCFHMTEAGPRYFSQPPRSIDAPFG